MLRIPGYLGKNFARNFSISRSEICRCTVIGPVEATAGLAFSDGSDHCHVRAFRRGRSDGQARDLHQVAPPNIKRIIAAVIDIPDNRNSLLGQIIVNDLHGSNSEDPRRARRAEVFSVDDPSWVRSNAEAGYSGKSCAGSVVLILENGVQST